jgi:hypothetical protein
VIYQTRIEIATIERMEKESSGSSMKSLLEDTARIEKEFRKLSEIEAGTIDLMNSGDRLLEAANTATEQRKIQK